MECGLPQYNPRGIQDSWQYYWYDEQKIHKGGSTKCHLGQIIYFKQQDMSSSKWTTIPRRRLKRQGDKWQTRKHSLMCTQTLIVTQDSQRPLARPQYTRHQWEKYQYKDIYRRWSIRGWLFHSHSSMDQVFIGVTVIYHYEVHISGKPEFCAPRKECDNSSEKNRQISITYFFMSDKEQYGDINIKYCPAEKIIRDYFNKPLQGSKLRKFRGQILNVQVLHDDQWGCPTGVCWESNMSVSQTRKWKWNLSLISIISSKCFEFKSGKVNKTSW